MAFCNSCGATLSEGTSFCGKCGAPVAGATPPRMTPAAPTGPAPVVPPESSNSALKTVLVVVGVIVILGIIAIITLTFVGLHIARNTRVTQEGDHVKVETPFGRVETSKDPEQAAKDLGIDVYPGATVQDSGAASVTVGPMRTVSASFESDDSAEKVCAFYKAKFPSAKVSTSNQNHCGIVSDDGNNVMTINVESRGDSSRFQITRVIKHATSSSQ
jgi:hypothetical protein